MAYSFGVAVRATACGEKHPPCRSPGWRCAAQTARKPGAALAAPAGFESMRGRATEQQHAGGVIHRARVTDRVGLLLAGGGTCASERTGKAGRTPRRGAPTVDATLTL
jgi:hypothetical protein